MWDQTVRSCDVTGNFKSEVKDQPPVVPKTEIELTAEKIGVTPAKLKAMREYAALLRKGDNKIKEVTIRKRICEKFKVKVYNESTKAG